MNITDLNHLFQTASKVHKDHEEELEKSGIRFNLFNILDVTTNEVKHSAFLTELLNPQGTHGFKDMFLKHFISVIESLPKDIHTAKAVAEYEFYIGAISEDYTRGGRIDIIIKNVQPQIIIENKIYASDQHKQLVRYNNYDKEAILLYLTLYDQAPQEGSRGELKHGEHYHNITYKKHISEWLVRCINDSASKPLVKETIVQYANLIKQLTNQTPSNMSNDLIELLKSNKDYFIAIDDINNAYNSIKNEVSTKFFDKIKGLVEERVLIATKDYLEFRFHAGEDGEGFFYGCSLFKDGSNYTDEGQMVALNKFFISRMSCKTFRRHSNWLGWTFSQNYGNNWKFNYLQRDKIYDLLNDSEMDNFVAAFKEEFDTFITNIKATLTLIPSLPIF